MSHNQNRGCAALVYTMDAGDLFFLKEKMEVLESPAAE